MSYPIPQPKVTLIMGSPRKKSTTHILLQEAGRALCEKGIATETVFPDDLTLRDCQGCHSCKQDGQKTCIIEDDMQGIYRLIDESAGLIIAAPVYFGYVPAMTKAWLDRLVPYIGPDMNPKIQPGKPVSFIFVQNMPDPEMFLPPLRSFMDSVAMTGLSVRDYVIATDCERGQKPPVTERPDLMSRAYAAGRDLLD